MSSRCTDGRITSPAQVARPRHDIAGDAKKIDCRQTKEDTNTCVKGDGGRLPQEFCQHGNCKVRIIIIVDGIAGEPHVVAREIRSTHDRCKKALIHKHFDGAKIRSTATIPATHTYHTPKNHT